MLFRKAVLCCHFIDLFGHGNAVSDGVVEEEGQLGCISQVDSAGQLAPDKAGGAADPVHGTFAGIGISILPMTVVYLILNKFFIAGLTDGAVKG